MESDMWVCFVYMLRFSGPSGRRRVGGCDLGEKWECASFLEKFWATEFGKRMANWDRSLDGDVCVVGFSLGELSEILGGV